MPVTVRVPIDFHTPRFTSTPGNAFWRPLGLTALDFGHWEFVQDVDGRIYGQVTIPKNLNATPNGKIILALAANATAGVTRMQVSTRAFATAESLNPATLTAETAQDITVPATAYLRSDQTFPTAGSLGETLTGDDVLLVEVYHVGLHANDTLATNTLLAGGWLECDVGT